MDPEKKEEPVVIKPSEEPAKPAEPAQPAAPEAQVKSQEQLIAEFESGHVDPEVKEAIEEEIKEAFEAKPIDGLHKKLLDSGTIEKWMLKILVFGFKGLNVWIWNMIFSKRKVIASDCELDDTDKMTLQMVCEEYAPKVMEFLRKLPAPLIALGFMEFNMIERMNRVAKILPPEEKKEESAEEKLKKE